MCSWSGMCGLLGALLKDTFSRAAVSRIVYIAGMGTSHFTPTVRYTMISPSASIGKTRDACDRCHSKKLRCEGNGQSCTRCAQGGSVCVFSPRRAYNSSNRRRRADVPRPERGYLVGPSTRAYNDGFRVALLNTDKVLHRKSRVTGNQPTSAHF
jgi:hypothetical protein